MNELRFELDSSIEINKHMEAKFNEQLVSFYFQLQTVRFHLQTGIFDIHLFDPSYFIELT